MRPFRPHDRPPVAAGNQHKAFSCGRCSQVRRHDFPVFNLITQLQKLPLPFLKGLPSFFLHRFPFPYRPPCYELLHIFQDNHPWADSPSPAQDNPRKPPDVPVYQCRTFGFGEVLTIRREPRKPHRAAPANFPRVYIPHARLQVFRVRVVGAVHQNRVRVMVDCYSDRTPRRQFDPRRRPSAAGEVVHDDFIQ